MALYLDGNLTIVFPNVSCTVDEYNVIITDRNYGHKYKIKAISGFFVSAKPNSDPKPSLSGRENDLNFQGVCGLHFV